MVSLSFLSYPHHGANTHSLPQWYKMATPPPPKKKENGNPKDEYTEQDNCPAGLDLPTHPGFH